MDRVIKFVVKYRIPHINNEKGICVLYENIPLHEQFYNKKQV